MFAHLLGPEGQLVAVDDHEPGHGSYPTTDWHPGDVIVDEHQLQIPEDAQPGEYALEIGLYDWRDGHRLHETGRSEDYVMLRPVTVQLPRP